MATARRRLIDRYKVQLTISALIRNAGWQVRRVPAGKRFLDVGCGTNTHAEFVNLDYIWSPGIDVCWDIVRRTYPFPDGRFEGIYTEHCLEHIPLEACERNLREFHRMLKPGGRVRIVVPDGEMLIDIYKDRRNGGSRRMPHEDGYDTMMQCINGVFRNHGHLFIYDLETMKLLLERSGFRNVERMAYKQGHEAALINDSEVRSRESLYVEAVK
ncbi:MAG TPA: methyltransferase domain-containing protein [Flavobacteriales bacterium]|nr:methyltransferase domain-containing protein [Flavobacteriales bacterium]HMR26628.1 methyltransferase domain-containing protein [Flavobacteriales bacterium]